MFMAPMIWFDRSNQITPEWTNRIICFNGQLKSRLISMHFCHYYCLQKSSKQINRHSWLTFKTEIFQRAKNLKLTSRFLPLMQALSTFSALMPKYKYLYDPTVSRKEAIGKFKVFRVENFNFESQQQTSTQTFDSNASNEPRRSFLGRKLVPVAQKEIASIWWGRGVFDMQDSVAGRPLRAN